MDLQLDLDTLRVRCTAGEPDPPQVTLAGALGHRVVTTPGRTETSERGRDRSLLERSQVGVSAQMMVVDAIGEVLFDRDDGRLGIETAVVDTVGHDDDIGCEPVSAHVGAFPHLFRPVLRESACHRPPTYRATRIVVTVRADQKDGRPARMSGSIEGGGDLRQILVTTPRSPLLTHDTGRLTAQHRPTVGPFAATATRALDQQYPCPCRLRGGEHERLGRRLEIETVEAVERPPTSIFDENPDEATRCCAGHRVTAHPGTVCAEEAFGRGHSAPSLFRGDENPCA